MDMSQVSEVKQTVEAYKELDGSTATNKQVEGQANAKNRGQIWQSELRNKISDNSQKPKRDEIV